MFPELERAIQLRTEGADGAEAAFQQLLQNHPQHALVHYHAAWLYDSLGQEREAVPYYERALALGLPLEAQRGALLGLGSTYRTLGDYTAAARTLERGLALFPQAPEFEVFYAMALYNLGRHHEAVGRLLRLLTVTTADADIQQYRRAIELYAEDLDRIWL